MRVLRSRAIRQPGDQANQVWERAQKRDRAAGTDRSGGYATDASGAREHCGTSVAQR